MTINKESFLKDVSKHTMSVLQDSGVFRHLSFSAEDTNVYSFQITTFPQHLVITGDCGTFVFNRVEDMFHFFRRHGDADIDASYWAEKVTAACDTGVRQYSSNETVERIQAQFNEWLASEDRLPEAVEDANLELEDFLGECEDETALRQAMQCIEAFSSGFVLDSNVPVYAFTAQYLWCLYAIVWGIEQYDKYKGASV